MGDKIKYNTVIFDMDGVITSEQNYWNCAALTVWETLVGDSKPYGEWDVPKIREKVFCGDRLISLLKNKGVNSNWDLGYVVICIAKLLGTNDFEEVHQYACGLGNNILEEYNDISKKMSDKFGGDYSRNSGFWLHLQERFQEWFLGDDVFEKTYGKKPVFSGKPGLVHSERPLISIEKLKDVLSSLKNDGCRLTIGTGRPYYEIYYPLKDWGLLELFDKSGFITYDDVLREEKLTGENLTKPHPYMFIKARMGKDFPFKQAEGMDFSDTLVVGDAGADMLAAKTMGADFCAVLTGVIGKDSRKFFEKNNADYIIDDVGHILEIGG